MPRTLAQNAQYIAETIKPAIKSAIEAQGVTVPSTDSFLDYADRIAEIEGGGSGYQLKDLPTGAISTVNDAAELPLNALKVSVEAWQEGSGDPSPSNIRPIHGWDSGEITVCDDVQNPTQTETYTQQFPATIYGAEWDVVNGGMKATNYFATLNGDEGFTLTEASGNNPRRFTRTLSKMGFPYGVGNQIISNRFILEPTVSPNNKFGTMRLANNTLVFPDSEGVIATASDFNQWLADNNTQICYKLATPTTTQLSPLSIRLLQGTNNLYADCGEVLEGEYFIGSSGAYDLYDYIQTDGTQLIDTGRAITAGDVVNTIFTAISGGSNGAYVWGKYVDPYYTALVIYPNNGFYRHYDHATVNDNPVDQTNFTVGKITEDSYTIATTLGGNYTLFDTASVKLYAFSINGDDYLPCKRRSDGKFGLYDVKNSTFLTDSASGNAITGGNNLGVRIG